MFISKRERLYFSYNEKMNQNRSKGINRSLLFKNYDSKLQTEGDEDSQDSVVIGLNTGNKYLESIM